MFVTRIAPSPTGDMHIGTARTAVFNWLAARASGGEFILRIDDTDLARSKPEYTQVIIDTMTWLGLDYDQIIHQSSRFEIYRGFAADLVRRGWAEERDGATVLVLKPGSRFPEFWTDEIAGKIKITPHDVEGMQGMVLIKSDGSPTYNFCTVVDDMLTSVNLIIRGTDHITNTARQVVLWNLISPDDGSDPLPKFTHVGLIHKDGKPLSKRDGASSMLAYRDKGYDPDAMFNFLCRLGWGPSVDDKTTAVLTRERMLELFLTGGKMKANAANMALDKLESYDRKYKARKGVWRNRDKLSD